MGAAVVAWCLGRRVAGEPAKRPFAPSVRRQVGREGKRSRAPRHGSSDNPTEMPPYLAVVSQQPVAEDHGPASLTCRPCNELSYTTPLPQSTKGVLLDPHRKDAKVRRGISLAGPESICRAYPQRVACLRMPGFGSMPLSHLCVFAVIPPPVSINPAVPGTKPWGRMARARSGWLQGHRFGEPAAYSDGGARTGYCDRRRSPLAARTFQGGC